MFQPLVTCLLLSAATGLSLRRFLLPYFPGGDAAEQRSPVTMVASAIFLAAVAFTVSDQKLWAIPIVLTFSLWLASVFDDSKPNMTIAISVVSLTLYMGLRSIH
ncbi:MULTISPECIES: hypothetical protein [Agrobacterium]|uniref:Uncharacterized protein n=1 Tax=Agrobacterium salinitolerans TaxID=1183413 RepID=A0A9X3KT62_9HYPH|nr:MULTISPECIES: hypothetical protein [Agrobacterium]SOC89966.1 hypothetical protein SAMN05421890_4960 [Ensifer adhaerens]MCZ7854901.1 hypothetical protein [Agrobacterium salinitolerans]MCZ7859589.1 hypothetical protein [Agrobacterium salinitolerans]MCZ7889763.1 hypothetical protein [Agrobacterium salinitolerans]MCZ7894642.1 hypothetical protein [Agrobacterium salinitolerans]